MRTFFCYISCLRKAPPKSYHQKSSLHNVLSESNENLGKLINSQKSEQWQLYYCSKLINNTGFKLIRRKRTLKFNDTGICIVKFALYEQTIN